MYTLRHKTVVDNISNVCRYYLHSSWIGGGDRFEVHLISTTRRKTDHFVEYKINKKYTGVYKCNNNINSHRYLDDNY